ncbi:MAG: hypothetical protein ABI388_01925 [Bacteroidia bacterium]
MRKLITLFLLLLLVSTNTFAQDDTTNTDDEPVKIKMRKGFQLGFSIGTVKANNYTAALYNGYGLDVYGHTNSFINSLMYQQIVNVYGGGNGYGTDRIAQALNVATGTWHFDNPAYMPSNMKYTIAFTAGLQFRYAITSRDAILGNVNTARISLGGNFTIETDVPASNGFQNNNNTYNYQTFSIIGAEQRTTIQLGYQHIFGADDNRVSFFMEGGLNVNLDKLMKNQLNINGLVIDLTSAYRYQYSGYSAFNSKYLSNVGFGGFLGAGLNINISTKWLVQLVYNPSFDKINIGAAPKYTFQNTLSIRGYYCF